MKYLKKSLLASALTLLAANTFAHGVWLDERTDVQTVIYGHGETDDAYAPAKLTIVEGYDKDGNIVAVEKKEAEKNVAFVIPDEASYISFVLDNGYWTEKKDGKWENKPKTEFKDPIKGGHYIKNAIAVINEEATVKPVDKLDLQIIPLENPLKKKAGDTLGIQVLFRGKPVEGAEITRDYVNMSHEHDIKTDKDGKATITIRNQGLNVIATDYNEPLKDDPKTDKNSYVSTFSFKLKHIDKD